MEQNHISANRNGEPDMPEEVAQPVTQQQGYLQRAVKMLSQRTKALLSPWAQRRLDDLHARDRGEAKSARPLTVTHRNTQLLLRRVQQARDHSMVWKPDIGALAPGLVERFSSTIADRAQTLRLIGIRRQPVAPATAWENNLELTLPVGPASPAGQVIDRSAPGPSIFAAGQPIEPFKPTAPIPARSPRPTMSPKPTRKPAQKQLPPQARLYARVEEIAPHNETPGREMREPLAAQVTPREMPQPASESPTVQRAPAQSFSLPEETTPPSVATPSVARIERPTEPPPPATRGEPKTVAPRQPEQRQMPSLPVQRAAVSGEVPEQQKPAPTTPSAPLLPEATPSQLVTEIPLAAEPSPVGQTLPPLPLPVEAPGIQRTAETSAPRAEQPRPRSSVEAPTAAKPVSPVEPGTRLPRAITEPPVTERPALARPPRALPIEPPTQIAKPAQRATTPAIPRAVAEPGVLPRPEPLPAAPQAPRRAIPPPRPVETTQTPRQPVTAKPEVRPAMPDFPRRVEIQRATEPAMVQAALPEREEAQPPSPIAAPPELRRTVTPPAVDIAASTTLAPQPDESIRTPPTRIPAAAEPPSKETVLPLRQVIQRRADLRSHGLLRKPSLPPPLRPIARIQPQMTSAADKMHVRPATDEMQRSLSTGAASPTLYARSPNLYVGPGPAPTVIRTGTLPQAQKRAQEGKPKPQPPMDLRTAMSTLSSQEQPLILPLPPQPIPTMTPATPPMPPPGIVATPPESTERPVAMPLARQQAAQPSVQTPRPSARTVESVIRPAVVGELVQRAALAPSAAEESAAPERIDLGELARKVYPFVKRLVAIEREREAR